MPDDLLDTDPSDFDITLRDYDFASKKSKLVTQKAELIRSLNKVPHNDLNKIQGEIFRIEEKIKQMDQKRLDAIS